MLLHLSNIMLYIINVGFEVVPKEMSWDDP